VATKAVVGPQTQAGEQQPGHDRWLHEERRRTQSIEQQRGQPGCVIIGFRPGEVGGALGRSGERRLFALRHLSAPVRHVRVTVLDQFDSVSYY